MTQPKSLTILALTAGEHDVLRAALAGFVLDPNQPITAAIGQARKRFAAGAPRRLRRALKRLRDNQIAALVVTNLPQDLGVRQGLLDPEVAVAAKATRFSEALVLGTVETVGHAYGVSTEGQGVINNLCPTRQHLAAFTGLGSARPLGMHFEHALLARLRVRQAPDGLVLVGVHGDPGGGPLTFIADGRSALQAVGAAHEATLRDPSAYYLRLPVRWRTPGRADGRFVALVAGVGACLSFAFALYGDMVEPATPAAAHALKAFAAALADAAAGVRIEPGTLAVINNRLAAHGRSNFVSAFLDDGTPLRWVQRGFWTADLARFSGWDAASDRVFIPPMDLV